MHGLRCDWCARTLQQPLRTASSHFYKFIWFLPPLSSACFWQDFRVALSCWRCHVIQGRACASGASSTVSWPSLRDDQPRSHGSILYVLFFAATARHVPGSETNGPTGAPSAWHCALKSRFWTNTVKSRRCRWLVLEQALGVSLAPRYSVPAF